MADNGSLCGEDLIVSCPELIDRISVQSIWLQLNLQVKSCV